MSALRALVFRLTNGIHLGGYSYIDVRGAPTRDSSDRDTIALNEISLAASHKPFMQSSALDFQLRSTFEVSEKESDCDTDRTEIMGSVDVALLTEAPSQPIIPRLNNEIDIVDENVENAHRSEMVKAKSAVEEVPSVFREMCHDVPSETICAVTGDGSQTDTSYRSFIMKRHSVEASENCPASPEYTHRAQQHQTERHENLIANPLRKSNKVHAVFIPAASNSVSEFERIYEGDESTIYNTISCTHKMLVLFMLECAHYFGEGVQRFVIASKWTVETHHKNYINFTHRYERYYDQSRHKWPGFTERAGPNTSSIRFVVSRSSTSLLVGGDCDDSENQPFWNRA
ncbi:unnamed protein product [Nippostrongylus brasiliensis]|uniref:Uncharacterized protein n=1 Tax=Nippostrongylus brasiliensis TaxID=27835 RepID=A0A0N4Y6Z1_NIPBR|nr:unnamed protein product [Nippostrongylus brasiliensis]